MKKIFPILFCFTIFIQETNAVFQCHLDAWKNRTYCDNVSISGFYHPNFIGNAATALPQVPLLHNYSMNAPVHRVYFAAQQELPIALKEHLKQVIDFGETEPEFYISIQCGTGNPVKHDRTYDPSNKDVDNIRPHYALFKDATPDNPTIIDRSYFKGANFEETFILPVMLDDIFLKACEANVTAHPTEEAPPETVLSGNSYILEGDRRVPWLFFSYFRTTEGRQLLTLHYVVDDDDEHALRAQHFSYNNTDPQFQSKDELFKRFNEILPDNPYMQAVTEIALNGNLTDFARNQLELSIAKKNAPEALEIERQRKLSLAREAEENRLRNFMRLLATLTPKEREPHFGSLGHDNEVRMRDMFAPGNEYALRSFIGEEAYTAAEAEHQRNLFLERQEEENQLRDFMRILVTLTPEQREPHFPSLGERFDPVMRNMFAPGNEDALRSFIGEDTVINRR